MLLIAIVAFLLAFCLWVHWSQRARRAAVANLTGPICPPIIGALHLMLKLNPKSLIDEGRKLTKSSGLQRIWAFNRLVIVSTDYEFNAQLMSSQEHLAKHQLYGLLKSWLGNSLLLSDGKLWHQRRKIITPAFHFSILEQFVEVFDQQSNVCVERLQERADGRTCFDVYPYLCLAALDIIAETAMGTKVYAQQAKSTPYADAVNECTALMAKRFLSVFLIDEVIFTLARPHLKWRQMQLIRTMHNFTTKVIEERRQALEQQLAVEKPHSGEDTVGSKRRMALLDVLLQATVEGRPLSNAEIREEVDTFMFAGHDTTTTAMCFCLWSISRHANVQEKLLAEILQVLGTDRRRAITMRDLNEMKYMECVIKETLRQYPSVPVVGRTMKTDFKYTHSVVGAGVIPAGSEVIMALIGMHNTPAYFEEPWLFKPERHESGDRAATFAYTPFSAGPRNCIGQKFAQLEMKMLLAKIVREFELLPLGEDVQPVVNIVLRSGTGIQLGLRKRSS